LGQLYELMYLVNKSSVIRWKSSTTRYWIVTRRLRKTSLEANSLLYLLYISVFLTHRDKQLLPRFFRSEQLLLFVGVEQQHQCSTQDLDNFKLTSFWGTTCINPEVVTYGSR
jgi:hypothetical protein